jgi:hypothetical protein
MKKYLVQSGFLALVLSTGYGCATSTPQKLNQLDLGMSQAQVKKILGDNYIAKASTTGTNGSHLQFWEYTDKKTREAYHVYFKDGQLAQWGPQSKLEFPALNLPK